MGVCNRDKDVSEQRDIWTAQTAVVGSSLLIQLAIAPCGQQVLAAAITATGLSGSPIVGLQIQRFVAGAGLTTIPLNGSSLTTVTAIGTSGPLNLAVPAAGSTLAQLFRNDVVQVVTSGANTAGSYLVELVTQTLQDIKQTYGV